jgi:hypothetical protein
MPTTPFKKLGVGLAKTVNAFIVPLDKATKPVRGVVSSVTKPVTKPLENTVRTVLKGDKKKAKTSKKAAPKKGKKGCGCK